MRKIKLQLLLLMLTLLGLSALALPRAELTVYSDCLMGGSMKNGERYTRQSLIVACTRNNWRRFGGRRVRLTLTSRGGVRRSVICRVTDTFAAHIKDKAGKARFDLSRRAQLALCGRYENTRWQASYEVLGKEASHVLRSTHRFVCALPSGSVFASGSALGKRVYRHALLLLFAIFRRDDHIMVYPPPDPYGDRHRADSLWVWHALNF